MQRQAIADGGVDGGGGDGGEGEGDECGEGEGGEGDNGGNPTDAPDGAPPSRERKEALDTVA